MFDLGPNRDSHAATRAQPAAHLRERGRSIRKELQSLLTDRDVELGIRDRQSTGRRLVVVDRRAVGDDRLRLGDREHRRAQVNTRHAAAMADLDRGEARHGSGAARDVEDSLSGLQVEAVEEQPRPGREEPRNEHILIDPHGRNVG